MKRPLLKVSGFTLIEIVITLSVLGVLAAFTIPQLYIVPAAKGSTKFNKMATNAAYAMMSAYQTYKLAGLITSATKIGDLTPYISYVNTTSGIVDEIPNYGATESCSAINYACVILPNGGVMWYKTDEFFNGTSTTNTIRFSIDPDGTSVTGVNHSQQFFLYYDGPIRTWSTVLVGTTSNIQSFSASNIYDTSWFNLNDL